MTFTIDTDQFLFDSLDRIFKQVHLNDNYEVGMFSPSDIPSVVRKLGKGIVPPDFFNGVKAKIIALKAKDPSSVADEDKIRIAKFVKTTFFLSNDSPFSANDVYEIKDTPKKKSEDDNEDSEESVKAVYFLVKMELVK